VSIQLRPRHRNEFGFGLEWLAHGDGSPGGGFDFVRTGCRFGSDLSRGRNNGAIPCRANSVQFLTANKEPIAISAAISGCAW
jgi:hypothetical protein